MMETSLPRRVEAIRHFNRFYTRQIGLLGEGVLRTPFTLTEGRVVYELAHSEDATATQLGRELGLDAGYLSRILSSFQKRGLIAKRPSESDGRQQLLELTEAGRQAFAELTVSARRSIEAMIDRLGEPEQLRLVQAMQTVQELLGSQPDQRVPYVLRPHQSGDLGWMVYRHAVLYSREYGWSGHFEALSAEVVADFLRHYDPAKERCWIAEREGERVGSVFLIRHREREGVAQLRMLLVEPKARGLGIGQRLVQECARFARQAGYHTITLWTNNVLKAARRIYEREGYRLIDETPHREFGTELIGQTWELTL